METSYEDLFFYLQEIYARGATEGVGVVSVLIPQRFQVSARDWRGLTFKLALEENAFALDLPNRRILEFCNSVGVGCLDLLPAFRMAANEEFYLPRGDMHWNTGGHRLAGQSLANYLLDSSHLP